MGAAMGPLARLLAGRWTMPIVVGTLATGLEYARGSSVPWLVGVLVLAGIRIVSAERAALRGTSEPTGNTGR